MKRNFHPYMSSTYINGYVKDQPLRNYTSEEIIDWFKKVNKEFGRRPIKHNGRENLTEARDSIQGKWHETMWNQYPKHLMEPKIHISFKETENKPLRPVREKKMRTNRITAVLRKNYKFSDDTI